MIANGFILVSVNRLQCRLFLLGSVFFVWLFSLAWVYPEHREISLIAIHDLDPDRQKVMVELWASARLGYENRLSALPADSTPFLIFTSLTTLTDMAVVAGNGGLIG